MSGASNRRSPEFRKLFEALPKHIQEQSRLAYLQFVDNPAHPFLRHHALGDNERGSHEPGSYSVSITRRYRAVYFVDEGVNVWYWIGTHADYDRLTGRK